MVTRVLREAVLICALFGSIVSLRAVQQDPTKKFSVPSPTAD